MNFKFLFGAIVVIPLLPLMYVQGKKIRASVPKLPEATGSEGYVSMGKGKELKLLAIGESTIAGVGVKTHDEGFTGTFAKELAEELGVNVTWKVYAKSGYDAAAVRSKILPVIEDKSADLIVIGLGGNDAFQLHNPKKWRNDILDLIRGVRTKFGQTPILFTNMPPIKEFPAFTPLIKFAIGNLVEILGDELEQLLQKQSNTYYYAQRLTLEDWIDRMGVNAAPLDFFSDGVHPSKLTYQVWAKDVVSYCMSNVEIQKAIRKRAILN
ncbi:MAG: SGNH/GDSL hydrolase family protein [Bacteroidota bacterium]